MSEENKVTAVEKSEKAKDPRKVELGKRLAKISREAKERKARQREAEREREKSEAKDIDRIAGFSDYVDFRYVVGGVTIVAALGGLYYTYKSDKRLERSETSIKNTKDQNKFHYSYNPSNSETKFQQINKSEPECQKKNERSSLKVSCEQEKSGCLENL